MATARALGAAGGRVVSYAHSGDTVLGERGQVVGYGAVALASLDLSFISLTLVLPKILELLRPGGEIVALVKPQFEVGKGQVGKGGVVRDPQLQEAAVQKVAAAAAALGLKVSPAFPSPLKGPKGNQEYFLLVIRPETAPDSLDKPHD